MFVMAGLVPAIHAFLGRHQGVDARHKAGHDVDGLSCHSATMNDATNMAAHKQSAEVLIERARSLIPVLRERAKQASADRRIPQETIDDIRRFELTRCLQPSMFGGFASDYRVFSKMLRTLAQGWGFAIAKSKEALESR